MKGHRGQDDVDTDVIHLAVADPAARRSAPAPARRATAPRTAPITVRTSGLDTPAKRRTAELLDLVLAGRSSHLTLWEHLQTRVWPADGLATSAVTQTRFTLLQHLLTQATDADRDWRAAQPRGCGAGPRTPIDHCTARDTCHRHRQHLALWMDAQERYVRALHDALPAKAREAVAAQPPAPPRTRRR